MDFSAEARAQAEDEELSYRVVGIQGEGFLHLGSYGGGSAVNLIEEVLPDLLVENGIDEATVTEYRFIREGEPTLVYVPAAVEWAFGEVYVRPPNPADTLMAQVEALRAAREANEADPS